MDRAKDRKQERKIPKDLAMEITSYKDKSSFKVCNDKAKGIIFRAFK